MTTQTCFLYDVGRFTWMMFDFNQTLVWNSLFLNLYGNSAGILLFYSHMLGLGSAALEGLVWFTDQTIAPALSTDKLHFHVQILPSSSFSSGFTPTTSRRPLHKLNENNEKTDLRSTLHLSLLIINDSHKKYLQSTNKKRFQLVKDYTYDPVCWRIIVSFQKNDNKCFWTYSVPFLFAWVLLLLVIILCGYFHNLIRADT